MGLLSKITKSGLATKAVDEARKPENQRKAKQLIGKARDRWGKGSGGSAGTSAGR